MIFASLGIAQVNLTLLSLIAKIESYLSKTILIIYYFILLFIFQFIHSFLVPDSLLLAPCSLLLKQGILSEY
jgi:hypothetical protein